MKTIKHLFENIFCIEENIIWNKTRCCSEDNETSLCVATWCPFFYFLSWNEREHILNKLAGFAVKTINVSLSSTSNSNWLTLPRSFMPSKPCMSAPHFLFSFSFFQTPNSHWVIPRHYFMPLFLFFFFLFFLFLFFKRQTHIEWCRVTTSCPFFFFFSLQRVLVHLYRHRWMFAYGGKRHMGRQKMQKKKWSKNNVVGKR